MADKGHPVHKVAICGFGLIGGSIALDIEATRERGVEIVAYDRRRVLARVEADRRFSGVRTERNFRRAVEGADLIILSANHSANESFLTRLATIHQPSGSLIIDTGAVKTPIIDLARSLTFSNGVEFLPSHPMAGREKAGAENALPGLFAERMWYVDENVHLSDTNRARWQWLVEITQTMPVLIDSELHDELMAELSHLPQLLSTILGAQVDSKLVELAGPGLESMLRLAGSPYSVWSEIIDKNRENVIKALRLYRENLDTVIDLIQTEESLSDFFAAAARSYRCLS